MYSPTSRTVSKNRIRQITIAIHLACASMAFATYSPPAAAQAAKAQYNIPAGPLSDALSRFAQQAGVAISFDAGSLKGIQTQGLNGSFNLDEGFERILHQTGYTAARTPAGYVLQAAPVKKSIAPNGRDTTLPAVTVLGSTETADGPVNGFVAKRSSTATKTDTSLSETPQSVSVVTREQVEAQAADSLEQALSYTTGVSMFEGGGTRSVGARLVIRGFNTLGQSVLYFNGSKFPTNSLSGSMEPYHFERIEVLKGPASIMYGQTTPGGIVNLVAKRPTAEPAREVELQLGSWNRKQLATDLSGPLTEDGRIRYRLTALQRDSDNMVKEYRNDRTSLNGTLEWQLTNSTLLSLLTSYDNTKAAFDPGKPLQGTLLPNPAGRISRNLYVGEPGKDRFSGRGKTLGYTLEHKFNDEWKFRQNVLAFDRNIDWSYVSIAANVDSGNPRLGVREVVVRRDTDRGISMDNQLHGKIQHGNVEHNLLFGLDFTKYSFDRNQSFELLPSLDLFSPVYGGLATYDGGNSGTDRAKQMGFYVQDQIKIDKRWIALIGGRYDTTRTDAGAGTVKEKADAFTPRLGLMYLFNNGITPYYSYSRSFMPTPGMDFSLNRFKPSSGIQHEIGLKYEPPGSNASITAAIFDITQRNNLTSDPDHTGFQRQTGEVRSRGLEIEARAEINRQSSVIAGFAITDAEITKSNQGNVGDRQTAVPRNSASIWLDHKIASIPGMSFGIGARYVGEQEVNRLPVPSFTVYDAALRYQLDKWQLALNLKNLTNKTYVAACPSVCYYGDERNALLTARYRW